MDTKWLEDFVSLAETRSFSRSAQQRHVTQPAFSRRIQALEAWAGVDLVDRSMFPTRLTPAGDTFLAQAVEMLGALQSTRNLLRSHQASASDVIAFAAPHSLAFAFFPQWLLELRQSLPGLKSRLTALNVHDAVLKLTEGHCDLLLAYHHEMLSLGEETLAPYARPDAEGNPLYRLPGTASRRVPFLGYAPGAYLSRLVEQILKHARNSAMLDTLYETDMAEGLKAMALEGHGLAFLPASSVRKEVRARKLVPAGESPDWALTMDVRIYRERPTVAKRVKPQVEALWSHLQQGLDKA
jgi:LysR family transcriptional regulator, hypochlorite-specific transcription factor HypT